MSSLPFEIVPGVHIEDVSSRIRKGDFDCHKPGLGEYRIRELERIKYAVIHRYPEHGRNPETGVALADPDHAQASHKLVQEIAACLRIIRPMTVRADFCEGKIAENGELYQIGFTEPDPDFSLPHNQRLFALRNQDVQMLRSHVSTFRRALAEPFWKFRMAVQMYNTGYFQSNAGYIQTEWKIRFFLWSSALEALFTTQNQNRQHSGSLVAKERIKKMLGANTSVYPPGELSSLGVNPNLTVSGVLDEIYCLRNHIAHGDKIPDYYYQTTGRIDVNGRLMRIDMLIENLSFIIRQCLLAIMKNGLLIHFQDAGSCEKYFNTLQLTKTAIQKRSPISKFSCPA